MSGARNNSTVQCFLAFFQLYAPCSCAASEPPQPLSPGHQECLRDTTENGARQQRMLTLSLGVKLRLTPSLVMVTVRMQPPEEPSRASA